MWSNTATDTKCGFDGSYDASRLLLHTRPECPKQWLFFSPLGPSALPAFLPLSSPPRSPPAVGVHAVPSAVQKSLIDGPSFGRSHNGGEHGICTSPPRAKARVLRLPSTNVDGRKNSGPLPLPSGQNTSPNAIAFGCVPAEAAAAHSAVQHPVGASGSLPRGPDASIN